MRSERITLVTPVRHLLTAGLSRYLFIHCDVRSTTWYSLLGDLRKAHQAPISVLGQHIYHTFFPKIVFEALPEQDFPVRRGYFVETTTTVWTFNLSARNAKFEDPELINIMLRSAYPTNNPRVALTRHLLDVRGLPYFNFSTPSTRSATKEKDDQLQADDSVRLSSEDEPSSRAGTTSKVATDEVGLTSATSVDDGSARGESETALPSPQSVPVLDELDSGWTDEENEDEFSGLEDEEDDGFSDFDGMPGFYAPALALDLQMDIPQAEIFVARFFTAEGDYADDEFAMLCAYKMFLAANEMCCEAKEKIKQEFTLTIAVHDEAGIDNWINTVSMVNVFGGLTILMRGDTAFFI